jgi:hypothetical protein
LIGPNTATAKRPGEPQKTYDVLLLWRILSPRRREMLVTIRFQTAEAPILVVVFSIAYDEYFGRTFKHRCHTHRLTSVATV